MNLQELQKEWEKDSAIDYTQMEIETLAVSRLHSKYLNYLSTYKVALRKLLDKKNHLSVQLFDYYEGKSDGMSLERAPFQLVLTKSGAEKRVEVDELMLPINSKIIEVEEIIFYLKEVIQSINQRTWQLKNYIEYMKWSGGSL